MAGRPQEPDNLLCPVLHIMFRDPVFIASGNTYERTAIVQYWSIQGHLRDPLTNSLCRNDNITTNWQMRRDVQAFLEANCDYIPEGWADRQLPSPVCIDTERFRQPQQIKSFGIVVIISLLIGWGLGSRRNVDSRSFGALYFPKLDNGAVLWARGVFGRMLESVDSCSGGDAPTMTAVLEDMKQDSVEATTWNQDCALAEMLAEDSHLETFLASGGIEMLLMRMGQHPTSRPLQCCGSKVLSIVTSGINKRGKIASVDGLELFLPMPTDAHLLEQIVLLRGIPYVLEAMQEHIDSADVQIYACKALMNLATNAESKALVVASGSLDQMWNAIKKHAGVPQVESECSSAMLTLADFHVQVTSGAVKRVLHAFDKQRMNPLPSGFEDVLHRVNEAASEQTRDGDSVGKDQSDAAKWRSLTSSNMLWVLSNLFLNVINWFRNPAIANDDGIFVILAMAPVYGWYFYASSGSSWNLLDSALNLVFSSSAAFVHAVIYIPGQRGSNVVFGIIGIIIVSVASALLH